MEKIILLTDTGCDLPKDILVNNGIEYLELTYIIEDKEYTSFDEALSFTQFYDGLSKGVKASTSCINEATFEEKFFELTKDGASVLYIAFSSGLSATYNNAVKAANVVNEKVGKEKVVVYDSLGASVGHGYIVLEANRLLKEGRSINYVTNQLKHTHIAHRFTVSDLMHLKRGGRLSGFAAVVGKMLNVQPMLICDNADGKLKVVDKIIGKKAVYPYFIKKMMAEIESVEEPNIYIGHAENMDGASTLSQEILKVLPKAHITTYYIGHVIGAHAGKGTIALFYKTK